MKIIVSFSGGKDSTACLLWAIKEYGVENIEAVFCDTDWEHEITYKYINETCKKLGVKLVVLKSKKYNGFLDLVFKKKRFPSTRARFCTEELKTKPMIDYCLNQKENVIMIQGIRNDESFSRSKMKMQCTYFKYYYESYALDKKGKYKYHTYRTKDVKSWRKMYNDDVLRPCIEWTGQDVINYILNAGLKPNPLYYMGFSRVGCMPCIMSKHSEILQISARFPNVIDKIRKAENEYKTSFFTNGKIPDKYCSKFNKKPYPTIDDVVKYVDRNKDQLSLFEEKDNRHSCMSFYGICE